MNLIYNVKDKPKFAQVLVFAFQQVLAILAATIAVPTIIGNGMSQSAALFGAGVGTLVYLLFTKFNSPVFLGSSFAFLGSMATAFAGGVSMALGYMGLILGAIFAGLVYVILSIIVKLCGVNWINKLMPPVIIGPTVAIIGLSLSGNAIGDLTKGSVYNLLGAPVASPYIALVCGLVTLAVTMICSVYGKKMMKMIPFIIGIGAGYALAAILTAIGNAASIDELMLIDFSKFQNMQWYPDFTFITAFKGVGEINASYISTIAFTFPLRSLYLLSTSQTTKTSPPSSVRIFLRIPVSTALFSVTVLARWSVLSSADAPTQHMASLLDALLFRVTPPL